MYSLTDSHTHYSSSSSDVIQRLVDTGLSHKEISFQLQTLIPERGLSDRSVRRYCKAHGIKKPCKTVVDKVVHDAIIEVSIKSFTDGLTIKKDN